MAEISVTQLNKYFGEHHVLQDISFELFKGERVSLIGQNGRGSLYINKNGRVGLLEQLPEYPEDVTVREVLFSAFEHIFETERRLRELEQQMDSDPRAMDTYATIFGIKADKPITIVSLDTLLCGVIHPVRCTLYLHNRELSLWCFEVAKLPLVTILLAYCHGKATYKKAISVVQS